MLAFDHFHRLRELFADQFEEHGSGFLYRKWRRGAPIPVSAAERDRYVAQFDRFTKQAWWGFCGGILLLCMSLATYATAAQADPPDGTLEAGLGAILVVFMASWFWSWNLPARELRDRGAVGEALTRAEYGRLNLTRTSYGQLALGAGAGVVLLLKADVHGNMLSGWGLVFTVAGAALLALTAVQVFRKWRLEQQPPPM